MINNNAFGLGREAYLAIISGGGSPSAHTDLQRATGLVFTVQNIILCASSGATSGGSDDAHRMSSA